jgi:transposase
MKEYTTYVALDTHKKEHRVAMQLGAEEQIQSWTVPNRMKELKRMVKRIQKQSRGRIEFCYEAGPCGFDLQRKLVSLGVECRVIAPSLVPRKAGERIKTDRRDALKLLEYQRAGLLTDVYPPSAEHEAVRDLCRCRQTVGEDLKRAQHRLLKFLLRHGFHYGEGNHWTQKHFRWLQSLPFEDTVQEYVYIEYLREVNRQKDRLADLDRELERLSQEKPYRLGVGALRCYYGIDTVTAMTTLSELYGFERFDDPERLMSFLGLTPSEHSSGQKNHKGGITKAGNQRLRRLLVESAWHYRHKPVGVSKVLKKRREGQPAWVVEQAEKARKRLHRRYWHLMNRGKNQNKTVVAVARELVGFIWETLYRLNEEFPEQMPH